VPVRNVVRLKWTNKKSICWVTALTVLGIVCFPANPLVFAGLIKTDFYPPLFIVGWIVWSIGMVLVMAPITLFPRRGGVPKGKSFGHTTRLVDTGVYAVVRHPQYLGGILSIFVTTMLWYPHWLFTVLGLIGTAIFYLSTGEEEERLIQQFGHDYIRYMQRVPRMNLVLGIIRLWSRRRHE